MEHGGGTADCHTITFPGLCSTTRGPTPTSIFVCWLQVLLLAVADESQTNLTVAVLAGIIFCIHTRVSVLVLVLLLGWWATRSTIILTRTGNRVAFNFKCFELGEYCWEVKWKKSNSLHHRWWLRCFVFSSSTNYGALQCQLPRFKICPEDWSWEMIPRTAHSWQLNFIGFSSVCNLTFLTWVTRWWSSPHIMEPGRGVLNDTFRRALLSWQLLRLFKINVNLAWELIDFWRFYFCLFSMHAPGDN